MGYMAEKKIVDGKKRRIKYAFFAVLFVVLVGLGIFSESYPLESWKYYFGLPKIDKRGKGEMRIHFLDVGQGDCTLVEFPDGQTLLVDGGNGNATNNKRIMRYLNALELEKIDYLLATHSDSDHVGALDQVLKYEKVGKVFYNADVLPNVNKQYAQFYDELTKSSAKKEKTERYIEIHSKSEKYPFTCAFLAPVYESNGSESQEESSAVVWLDYLGVSALFTGDSPISLENQLALDDSFGFFDGLGVELSSTEILKVGHHGSLYSTGEDFVRYLNAQTAVISCGKGNAYGHPNDRVLETLETCGVAAYRTDESGNIVVTVKDGSYKIETFNA